jgi:xanthine dehydrogenase accessory factor
MVEENMKINELFSTIIEKTSAGADTVLATVVAEMGSSPRSAGAHMLVGKDGWICGTIGGGMVEYRSIQFALSLLDQQKSHRKRYQLHKNEEEDLGMLCGGDVEVYFQFIQGGDKKTITFMKEALVRLEEDEDLWLFIDLSSQTDWIMALYSAGAPPMGMELRDADIAALARNKGVIVKVGSRHIYGEPINFAGKVFIFGGGHVAQALVPVLSTVGFRCVVFDNREEFVERELFPTAYDLVYGGYDKINEKLLISSKDYIVIMTHAYDVAVLREVVAKDCVYFGLIGSKTKVATVKKILADEGVREDLRNRMNAPIGLRIKAETPEEIAVSVAGEMILCRAERRAMATGKGA